MLEIVHLVEGEGGPLRVQARQSNYIISRTEVLLRAGAYDISYDGMYYIPLI